MRWNGGWLWLNDTLLVHIFYFLLDSRCGFPPDCWGWKTKKKKSVNGSYTIGNLLRDGLDQKIHSISPDKRGKKKKKTCNIQLCSISSPSGKYSAYLDNIDAFSPTDGMPRAEFAANAFVSSERARQKKKKKKKRRRRRTPIINPTRKIREDLQVCVIIWCELSVANQSLQLIHPSN